MRRNALAIAIAIAALAACIDDAPAPGAAPVLDATGVALFEQERGRPDYVQGNARAAAGATEITLYADAALTREIAWGRVAVDGSFGPVEIGDDTHARVWLVASNDLGNSAAVQLHNEPHAPMEKLYAASTSAAFVSTCDEAGCGNARTLNGASFEDRTIPEWTNLADDSHQLAVHSRRSGRHPLLP